MSTGAVARRPGRLIAVEGIDGSGKSTQARLLADAAGATATREPGATSAGDRLRAVLLDPTLALTARAEALVVLADRAEHVAQVVAPALAAGAWVVTDRFSPSTLAYQGHGRGLPVGELAELDRWATDGLEADLVVLVDVPVSLAAERLRRRPGGADRFEGASPAWQERVRQGFLALAAADPGRWVVVDGARPVAQVAADVRSEVDRRLGPPAAGWR